MRQFAAALVVAALAATAGPIDTHAQGATPYKLGMFQQGTRTFPGLVLNDTLVVDLSAANVGAPPTLKALIAAWEPGIANRIATLAAAAAKSRPAGAFDIGSLKTLPPIPDPGIILNTAVNYQEHAAEMRSTNTAAESAAKVEPKVAEGIPGYWNRRPGDLRQNPFFFIKAQRAITGHGDPILLPPGRTRIDWECELAVVIGKTAKRVKAENAAEYVFGYTLENDVSDRGGRADGRHGSDWLVGKSHDTFAPMGPFIVPRAFVPDVQNLRQTFTLSGKVMQDGNTNQMVHNVLELVEYASHLMTLHPGDIIAGGSPAGVGAGRATPVFFKDGDTSVCTIERIGTLQNTVRAEK